MKWLKVTEQIFKDFTKEQKPVNTTHRNGYKYYITITNKSISKFKDNEYFVLNSEYDSYIIKKMCDYSKQCNIIDDPDKFNE